MLLAAAIVILALVSQWNWFAMPLERDEGEYAYSGWLLRTGGVPYRDAFLQKPPLIVYTYALAQVLSEDSVWPVRALAFVSVLLAAASTAWAARLSFGPRCASVAALIAVPMLGLPELLPTAANVEKFMVFPMMLAVALRLRGRRDPRSWIPFAAGAAAAAAVLYKPICLPALGLLFLLWGVEALRQESGVRNAAAIAGAAIGGASAVAALALAFFVRHGAIGAMWETTVRFNRAYSGALAWEPEVLRRMLEAFLTGWWPLVPAAAVLVIQRPKGTGLWVGLLAVSAFVASKDPNGHYWLMVVPFLAVVAARGLEGLADVLGRRIARDPLPVVATAAAALLFLPLAPQVGLTPVELTRKLYGTNPFLEAPAAAKALAAVTEPDDYVFVAGSEAQILFGARRRSATRFVIMYPLTLDTALAPAYQGELLRDLGARPPRAIVLSNVYTSWLLPTDRVPPFVPSLQRLIAEEYRPVGHWVWDREEQGSWRPWAPTSGRESLVLFVRKG